VEAASPTIRCVVETLETNYPMLRGTIRDQVTGKRRPFLRYFACEQDLSHDSPDDALPDAVISGKEPLIILGAIAGGAGKPVLDPGAPSKARIWTGRILTGLITAFVLVNASMILARPKPIVEGFARYGFQPGALMGVGLAELIAIVLYAIPQTAVLGAILLTGYLGGATVTHARIGENFIFPILLGVLVWLAVYLRDNRLQALVPFRR
jgi:hypothetical protein